MNDDVNIYETLGISIYCSYPELIKAYSDYFQENVGKKLSERRKADKLLEEHKWLEGVKEILEQNGYRYYDKRLTELQQGTGKEIYEKYCRYLSTENFYAVKNEKIKKTFQENGLDIYTFGEQNKRQYDQTHCTPYAILGTFPSSFRRLCSRSGEGRTVDKKISR